MGKLDFKKLEYLKNSNNFTLLKELLINLKTVGPLYYMNEKFNEEYKDYILTLMDYIMIILKIIIMKQNTIVRII